MRAHTLRPLRPPNEHIRILAQHDRLFGYALEKPPDPKPKPVKLKRRPRDLGRGEKVLQAFASLGDATINEVAALIGSTHMDVSNVLPKLKQRKLVQKLRKLRGKTYVYGLTAEGKKAAGVEQ